MGVEEPPDRPQVSSRYGLRNSLNVAWLGYGLTTRQCDALDDAWDLLVVEQEWRDWVQEFLIPASPMLYLAVRDDLPDRVLRKTPSGASLQLPAVEVARADAEGGLIDLYLGVTRDIYARWARGSGHPPPPDLPT